MDEREIIEIREIRNTLTILSDAMLDLSRQVHVLETITQYVVFDLAAEVEDPHEYMDSLRVRALHPRPELGEEASQVYLEKTEHFLTKIEGALMQLPRDRD